MEIAGTKIYISVLSLVGKICSSSIMSVWVSQINRNHTGICIWFYGGAIAQNVMFWVAIFCDGPFFMRILDKISDDFIQKQNKTLNQSFID